MKSWTSYFHTEPETLWLLKIHQAVLDGIWFKEVKWSYADNEHDEEFQVLVAGVIIIY
jgi:hypothetical protein